MALALRLGMSESWRSIGTDARAPSPSSASESPFEEASGSASVAAGSSFWNRLGSRRRWLLLSIVIAAASLAFFGVAAAPDYLLDNAEAKLAATLGGEVTIGSIEPGMETVTIRELSWRSAGGEVEARAESLLVRGFHLPAFVAGERPQPEAIEGQGLHLVVDLEGEEARRLAEDLRNRGATEKGAAQEDVQVSASGWSLRDVHFDLSQVRVEILDGRGPLVILEEGSLAGTAATPVAVTAARLALRPRAEGAAHREESAAPSWLLDLEAVDGELRLNPDSESQDGAWRFAGRLEGQHFVTTVRGLAESPVKGGPWAGEAKGSILPREDQPLTIRLEEGRLRHRELETRLAGQLALIPGDEGLGFQLEGAAHLPATPCQAFAEGIPVSILGAFSNGLEMQG